MAQTAKLRTSKRTTITNPRPSSAEQAPLRTRPRPNADARRKRQLTQRMRRFEAAVVRLPRSLKSWRLGWSLSALRRFGFTGWQASKVLSIVLFLGAAGVIAWVHTDDQWFVYQENVQFKGIDYLDAKQLYQASGIDAWNIFWLQPETVRQRLTALPYITDVQVQTRLPNHVVVTLQEAQPVAIWVTDQGAFWVLADGVALPEQGRRHQDAPQIIDTTQAAKALDTRKGLAIDPNILQSALAIKRQLPEISQLRFNKDYGLNFRLPSSDAWVYWGDGYKMENKFTNLAAIQHLIQTGKVQPQIIDVRYDRPYMR